MNCGEWKERIAEQTGDGFSTEVQEHLRLCSSCATLAEDLENDRLALAATPPDAGDAAYAAMRGNIRSMIVRERRTRGSALALLTAAAAAIVVIAWMRPGVGPVAPVTPHVLSAAIPRVVSQPEAAAPRRPKRRHPRVEAVISPADLALLRKVTGQEEPQEAGSDSAVEMRLATANPDVTIILLQAKERSHE